MSLSRAIEAMLLMATEPVSAADLAAALDMPEREVISELEALSAFYHATNRGFELRRIAGGWRLATAEDLADVIENMTNVENAIVTQGYEGGLEALRAFIDYCVDDLERLDRMDGAA